MCSALHDLNASPLAGEEGTIYSLLAGAKPARWKPSHELSAQVASSHSTSGYVEHIVAGACGGRFVAAAWMAETYYIQPVISNFLIKSSLYSSPANASAARGR